MFLKMCIYFLVLPLKYTLLLLHVLLVLFNRPLIQRLAEVSLVHWRSLKGELLGIASARFLLEGCPSCYLTKSSPLQFLALA